MSDTTDSKKVYSCCAFHTGKDAAVIKSETVTDDQSNRLHDVEQATERKPVMIKTEVVADSSHDDEPDADVCNYLMSCYETNSTVDTGPTQNITSESFSRGASSFEVKLENSCNVKIEVENNDVTDSLLDIKPGQSCFELKTEADSDDIIERSHDDKIRPYLCAVCNKRFTHLSHFDTHTTVHTEKMSHLCTLCDKRFTNKSHFEVHKRKHSGERPFLCTVCSKGFTQLSSLNTHKRTHTGERPYLCTVCNKGFSQRGHLNTHKITHTGERPYVCTVCKKAFACKGNLVAHNRIHAGEKPFLCTVCYKGFNQLSSLKRHKSIHTDERS